MAVNKRNERPKLLAFFAAKRSATGPNINGPIIDTNGAIMLMRRYSSKLKPSSRGLVA